MARYKLYFTLGEVNKIVCCGEFIFMKEAMSMFSKWQAVKNIPVSSKIQLCEGAKVLFEHITYCDYWHLKHLSSPHWKSRAEINNVYKQFNISNFVKQSEEFIDYYTDDQGTYYYNELSVMSEYARLNEAKLINSSVNEVYGNV